MTPAALRLIPPPAVTLALMFGAGTVVVADAAGRQQRVGEQLGDLSRWEDRFALIDALVARWPSREGVRRLHAGQAPV